MICLESLRPKGNHRTATCHGWSRTAKLFITARKVTRKMKPAKLSLLPKGSSRNLRKPTSSPHTEWLLWLKLPHWNGWFSRLVYPNGNEVHGFESHIEPNIFTKGEQRVGLGSNVFPRQQSCHNSQELPRILGGLNPLQFSSIQFAPSERFARRVPFKTAQRIVRIAHPVLAVI